MLFYHFWFILWTGKIAFFGLWFFTISICFSDCVWLCFCFWNLLSPFRILLQKCLIWRVLFLSIFTKNHCYYTRRMSSPTLCAVSKPVKLCNAHTHTRISKHSGSIPESLKFHSHKYFWNARMKVLHAKSFFKPTCTALPEESRTVDAQVFSLQKT